MIGTEKYQARGQNGYLSVPIMKTVSVIFLDRSTQQSISTMSTKNGLWNDGQSSFALRTVFIWRQMQCHVFNVTQ